MILYRVQATTSTGVWDKYGNQIIRMYAGMYYLIHKRHWKYVSPYAVIAPN